MDKRSSKTGNSRAERSAKKQAAREEDKRLLASGVSPTELQQRNSAFPPGMFAGARIENLPEAVGQ